MEYEDGELIPKIPAIGFESLKSIGLAE
ncbi:uncharacterized protein G2W53_030223 [Senna tora]|uniref:Uncharacterized protein n=1 Tax=Senna tora TaxID=362788 RepID=A0A834TFC2_9FABA|nr:uncharacterized protein G2W53_030223 [Senna tora]